MIPMPSIKHYFLKIFVSFTLLFFSTKILLAQGAFTFSGKVIGTNDQILPYASIAVDDARYGTLSDENGYFSLKLPVGKHTVIISYLGYKRISEIINIQGDLEKNYRLLEEQLVLEEVLISSDGRDPAYGIMRKAIENKKKNAQPFPEYAYQAYTKSEAHFQEGFEIDSLLNFAKGQQEKGNSRNQPPIPLDIFKSDLLFFSENVSKVSIKEPNQLKEEIISSRVSGDSDQFSFMGNLFNFFDPYENRMELQEVANRGIVSPLSDNAFFFYDFKLLGSIQEANYKAFKIQLIPKRIHDPVYSGIIYIADSSYAIKEIDWKITKTQSIELLDTLIIQQEFQPMQNAWMPFKSRVHAAFSFNFLVFTLPFAGSSMSILSDYDLNPDFRKKQFSNEIVSISDSAMSRALEYWQQIRPVPLTAVEQKDTEFKDSLEKIYKSPAYLDSLTKARSKLKPLDFLFGKEIQNYRKKTTWRIKSMLNAFGYNAIEGWFVAAGFDREWELKKERSFRIGPDLRYSFGDKKFSYQLSASYRGSGKHNERLSISGGDYVSQFSRFPQLFFMENTLTSLFAHESFIRLYRKRFGEISYRRELFNGFSINGNLRYEDRLPLQNTSEYSFLNKDKTYLPNIDSSPHKAFIGEIHLSILPFNKYVSIPNGKFSLGSKFPLIAFIYTTAIPVSQTKDGRTNLSAKFSHVKARISKQMSLGLVGNSTWRVEAGRFINKDDVFFADRFHFKGNQTPFHLTRYDEFFLLPYYETSNTKPYIEAHLEHAFSGFLLNKIPGLRSLKLREYTGIHYLIQENGRPYVEVNFGLQKLLFKIFPFRIDGNVRLTGDTMGRKWGFKIVAPLVSLGVK